MLLNLPAIFSLSLLLYMSKHLTLHSSQFKVVKQPVPVTS